VFKASESSHRDVLVPARFKRTHAHFPATHLASRPVAEDVPVLRVPLRLEVEVLGLVVINFEVRLVGLARFLFELLVTYLDFLDISLDLSEDPIDIVFQLGPLVGQVKERLVGLLLHGDLLVLLLLLLVSHLRRLLVLLLLGRVALRVVLVLRDLVDYSQVVRRRGLLLELLLLLLLLLLDSGRHLLVLN